MAAGAEFSKVNIVQGEFHTSADEQVVITTLLGSCIAACLYDPMARIGGMNHFLLPGELDASASQGSKSYGVHLMELLINALLKTGAARHRLQAKVFGGARTIATLGDIGAANAAFAKEFLELEGIRVAGTSTGGVLGRRLQFWPTTGRANQMYMRSSEKPAVVTQTFVKPGFGSGELELF
jgi:chemotaxis protein CheD